MALMGNIRRSIWDTLLYPCSSCDPGEALNRGHVMDVCWMDLLPHAVSLGCRVGHLIVNALYFSTSLLFLLWRLDISKSKADLLQNPATFI